MSNLSPWFKPSEPPVRPGWYQIKLAGGEVVLREYSCTTWWDGLWFVPHNKIVAWRGVVR